MADRPTIYACELRYILSDANERMKIADKVRPRGFFAASILGMTGGNLTIYRRKPQ